MIKSFLGETRSFCCCLHFGCFGQSSLKVTHSGDCCPALTVMSLSVWGRTIGRGFVRDSHGRCVILLRPIPASQLSKETKLYQTLVIVTVKCHIKGMYRRCHPNMFPHNVNASSSRIVPYLEGTCGRYFGSFLRASSCELSKSRLLAFDSSCQTCYLSYISLITTNLSPTVPRMPYSHTHTSSSSILSNQIVSVSGSSAIAILLALSSPPLLAANTNSAARNSSTLPRNGRR
jgi:hypothetical protein